MSKSKLIFISVTVIIALAMILSSERNSYTQYTPLDPDPFRIRWSGPVLPTNSMQSQSWILPTKEFDNWGMESSKDVWIPSDEQPLPMQSVGIDDWTYFQNNLKLSDQTVGYDNKAFPSNYWEDTLTMSWTINPAKYLNLSQLRLQDNTPFLIPRPTSYQKSTPWTSYTQSNYNLTSWNVYSTNITAPYFSPSYEDSLLLEVGKPAIYLYPEKDTYINVILTLNGILTDSDPDYQGGWNVFAMADGTLIIDSLEYDYLFWEGNIEYDLLSLPDEGWIIAQEHLATWFDINLNTLGLTNYEKQEFIEYWVARLQDFPYYEIKLVDQEVFNNHATLSITTSDGSSPDTMIRIIFHFRGLDEYEYIESPEIVTPERNGFVVVEWGGLI